MLIGFLSVQEITLVDCQVINVWAPAKHSVSRHKVEKSIVYKFHAIDTWQNVNLHVNGAAILSVSHCTQQLRVLMHVMEDECTRVNQLS